MTRTGRDLPTVLDAQDGVIYATLDGYDALIDETEAEVERLQDSASGRDRRVVTSQLLQQRRRMMTVRGQLSGQREMFADLARSGRTAPPDGAWWINDRLEAAITGAREAADYALAGSWSLHQGSRRQGREVGLALLAAWSTWLGLLVITRLASAGGPSAIDPLWYVGGLLAVISVLVLATVASRRWL